MITSLVAASVYDPALYSIMRRWFTEEDIEVGDDWVVITELERAYRAKGTFTPASVLRRVAASRPELVPELAEWGGWR